MSYREEDFDFLKNETDIFPLDKYMFFTSTPEDYQFEEDLDAISSASTPFAYDTCSELSTPFDHDICSELLTRFDYDSFPELSTVFSPIPEEEVVKEIFVEERDFLSDKSLSSLRRDRELFRKSIEIYRSKREKRVWRSRIVYKVRQKLANERPRKNGRFTKN